uniref:Uncharacterized protein n=1 Tax=Plectus sambesii TaxID=2011161 RepID=A0A914X051_9BILA
MRPILWNFVTGTQRTLTINEKAEAVVQYTALVVNRHEDFHDLDYPVHQPILLVDLHAVLEKEFHESPIVLKS